MARRARSRNSTATGASSTPTAEVADWRFPRAGRRRDRAGQVSLRVNNGDMMRDAAIAGLGIALLPMFIAGSCDRSRGACASSMSARGPRTSSSSWPTRKAAGPPPSSGRWPNTSAPRSAIRPIGTEAWGSKAGGGVRRLYSPCHGAPPGHRVRYRRIGFAPAPDRRLHDEGHQASELSGRPPGTALARSCCRSDRLIHGTTFCAMKPPRLPTELIAASPAAAEAPVRNFDGRLHSTGCADEDACRRDAQEGELAVCCLGHRR